MVKQASAPLCVLQPKTTLLLLHQARGTSSQGSNQCLLDDAKHPRIQRSHGHVAIPCGSASRCLPLTVRSAGARTNLQQVIPESRAFPWACGAAARSLELSPSVSPLCLASAGQCPPSQHASAQSVQSASGQIRRPPKPNKRISRSRSPI